MVWSLVYGPDTVSTANLMTDIAEGLQARGHTVSVVTSTPHYNPAPSVLADPRYHPRFPRFATDSTENGVRVLRVRMPLKGQRILRRAFEYMWFHLFGLLVVLRKLPSQHVILVTSPPITLGLVGWVAAVLLRASFIYDVRELWPDVPVRMGIIRGRWVIRAVGAAEAFVYRKATLITCIARSFERSLIARGVPEMKLRFAPNFVDVEWLRPESKNNPFARQEGLVEKFVVLYAGNIGLTQGLEILVDVARQLRADEDIVVLVIGDGAGRAPLERALQEAKLPNIRQLPFQPYSRIRETYAAADICVSPMRRGYSYDTVPSKIYTALAAGKPVIAASEQETETAQLLQESKAGVVVQPESSVEIVEAVLRLYHDRGLLQSMAARGRDWIVRHYSREAVINTYDDVIREAGRIPSATEA